MKAIELLLSDSRGIYIPMTFAQGCLDYPSDSENGWEFSEDAARVLYSLSRIMVGWAEL